LIEPASGANDEIICGDAICTFFLFATWSATVFAQPADTILINGKIVTVDDHFRTVQAVAIQGGRIVAMGGNDEVQKLKGPATRLIDVQGRTVIPGLIDNHAHYMRAAEYWHSEVRLDGVTSRKQALDLMREKVRESKPGEWVVVLGGWSEEQFTDEARGFTRKELDEIAPNNPLALQLFYFRVYANSPALKAMGIEASTPDPANFKIDKDAQGQLTGALNGGVLRKCSDQAPYAIKQPFHGSEF
jgi:predicted amidohydrolase YtcJ